jgi:prophage regulatory protein
MPAQKATPKVAERTLLALPVHSLRRTMPPVMSEPQSASSGRIRILRLPQVLDVTGLGKTKIYELQSQGSFPMRVQITAHSVGWIEEEVQAWLARRVAISASLLRAASRQASGIPGPGATG